MRTGTSFAAAALAALFCPAPSADAAAVTLGDGALGDVGGVGSGSELTAPAAAALTEGAVAGGAFAVGFPWWMWAAFFALVALVLAFDLGIFGMLKRLILRKRADAKTAAGQAFCMSRMATDVGAAAADVLLSAAAAASVASYDKQDACPTIPAANADVAPAAADARGMPFGKALVASLVPVSLAVAFGVLLFFTQGAGGAEIAETFAAGYLMELALSVDNLFVFLLVFAAFHIAPALQHRVLFWGVFGAIAMRAAFIFCGVTLLETFAWLMLVFGAVLLVSAVKLLLPKKETPIEKNLFVRLARKIFPVSAEFRGQRFFFRDGDGSGGGRLTATPLFLALVVIEGTDVVFAVDSVPAVMGLIPPKMPYDAKLVVAFTSNIFAILGLRSLFFVLSSFLKSFWLLEYGLALILGFIGVKMVLTYCVEDFHLSPAVSLGVLVAILAATVGLSLVLPRPENHAK